MAYGTHKSDEYIFWERCEKIVKELAKLHHDELRHADDEHMRRCVPEAILCVSLVPMLIARIEDLENKIESMSDDE